MNGTSYSGCAEGTTKCVAPYARISVYKVSWGGAAALSDLFAAMDQAIADGVGVICLAMGPPRLEEGKLSLNRFCDRIAKSKHAISFEAWVFRPNTKTNSTNYNVFSII